MTIEELYDLLSKRIDKIDTRLDGIDGRLYNVENAVPELQGRKAGIGVVRDWIVGLSAIYALIIPLTALLK